jgi:hypothetical protein
MSPKDTHTEFDGCSDGIVVPRFTPKEIDAFKDAPLMTWIVKQVIPRSELVVIYGESGCGKSFLALNLGMAIARGLDWHGYKSKPGRVIYVCAESPSGFRGRVKAYCMRHALQEQIPFQIIDDAPDFLTEKDPKTLIERIGKADVIFIDTLARVTAGADENTGQDMGPVIARCQAIQRATGALVILIHHSGKDTAKGSRGWSGIRAAADTEIFVEKLQSHHSATITKQKDGPDLITWGFNLPQYAIGEDEDGDEITSCTYEPIKDMPAQRAKTRKLGGWQATIMKCFDSLIDNESNGWLDEEILINEVLKNSARPPKNKRDTRPQVIRTSLTALYTSNLLQSTDGKVTKKQ